MTMKRDAVLAEIEAARSEWMRVDLSGRDLSGLDLTVADLTGADLRRTDLSHAILAGASLRGASMRGADLSGADLSGADLRGADLSGANLRWAILAAADLAGARGVRSVLADDGRGYHVVAVTGATSDGEPIYQVGYLRVTISGARRHWASGCSLPGAAAVILAAIEADYAAWENAAPDLRSTTGP